ncbi:hypothetical protein BDR03DRAFT_971866, partial [Suillus americanus]
MSTSELLRQSMQNLRVSPLYVAYTSSFELVTQNQVAETKSTLPPLVPFKFTSPPRKFKLSYPALQHYKQNFGFWLSDQWLIELGKHTHLPEDRFDPPLDEDFWMRGVAYICETVGLEGLTVEHCFQPKTNGAPPQFLDADGEVLVLSVCDDVEDDIPSQQQVDYLTNLLCRPPQWWINIYPRN